MVAFGRLPGFAAVARRMKAETYVRRVVAGDLRDSALTAHLRAGYRVLSVRSDLMPDSASANWATLLEYENPHFDARKRRPKPRKGRPPLSRVRVCAVQWRLRDGVDMKAFVETASYFGRVASEYGCHVLVFPELVAASLLSAMRNVKAEQVMWDLAGHHQEYVETFRNLAISRQLFVVAGSHPVIRDEAL